MGRKQSKAKAKQGGEAGGEGDTGGQAAEYTQPVDPPRAVIAVHPLGAAVAVAVGPELRVYDCKNKQLRVLVSKPAEAAQNANSEQATGNPQKKKAPAATASVLRGVAFDASGRFLLAGSEEKAAGLRVWDCSNWELLQSIKAPKKVTNVAFTPDGKHLLASDKFGDVLTATTEPPTGLPAGQQQEPEVLLGHYCAIITSMALSSGGKLISTTDRDQRVRVSIMPQDPMAGAHEIQSYCLGHTSFVACSAFIQQDGQELLVTGGGDGTLRLWDPLCGALLHTLQLPPLQQGVIAGEEQQEGQQEGPEEQQQGGGGSSDGGAEGDGTAAGQAAAQEAGGGDAGEAACGNGAAAVNDAAVPLAMVAAPDGSCLIAAVDGRDELCLVRLDWASRQLHEAGWFGLSGLHLPAALTFDGAGRLWAAGGPVADESVAAFVACGSITPGSEGHQAQLVDAPLPDWLSAEAVQQLEAKTGTEAEQLTAAAEKRRLASQVLKKRQYSLLQLENRKRLRRDKVAAASAAAAGEGGS